MSDARKAVVSRAAGVGTMALAWAMAVNLAAAASQPTDGQWCGVNGGGRAVGFVVSDGGTKVASGFFSYSEPSGTWQAITVANLPISDGQFDLTRDYSFGRCIGHDHVGGAFATSTSASGDVVTYTGGGATCPISYGSAFWTAAPIGTSEADLVLSLGGSTGVATPPTRLVFTTTVTNQGALPADGVQLSATLPAGLAFVANSGDCSTPFPCALGTLAACENRTVTTTVDIPSGYAGPDTAVHTFTASSTTPEASTQNNAASWSIDILHPEPARLWVVEPCRLLDTRQGSPLAAGATQTVVATGQCGVPATARALALNLTVTGSDRDGDLRVFPVGVAAPLASALNFRAAETRANNAVIRLGPAGDFVIQADLAGAGSVHVIVDVAGYFE
jgi:uncharacterized repeat protein (TIGR01451 family)